MKLQLANLSATSSRFRQSQVATNTYRQSQEINERIKKLDKEKLQDMLSRNKEGRDISNLFEKHRATVRVARDQGLHGCAGGEEMMRTFHDKNLVKKSRPPQEVQNGNEKDLLKMRMSLPNVESSERSTKPIETAIKTQDTDIRTRSRTGSPYDRRFIPEKPSSESVFSLEALKLQDHIEALCRTDFFKLTLQYHCLRVYDESLLLSLYNEIPHCLQNYPSNKQETLRLRAWYETQLGKKSAVEEREEVCKLAILESLRQEYVSFSERGSLLLDSIEEYVKLQVGKAQAARSETSNMRMEFEVRFEKSKEVFDRSMRTYAERTHSLQQSLDATALKLSQETQLLMEKDTLLSRVTAKCDFFQAAAVKFKNTTLKYYQLVEDLKEMIRMEKKWSTVDFDQQIKKFKFDRKLTHSKSRRSNSLLSMSVMDDRADTDRDAFESNEGSEDEEEFEAKRIKDAESKVIQDIFGGKESELGLNMLVDDGGLMPSSVRKLHKQTQTDLDTMTQGCQTNISLVNKRFDAIFISNQAVEDLVSEIEFKQTLMVQMTEKEIEEHIDEHEDIQNDKLLEKINKIVVDAAKHYPTKQNQLSVKGSRRLSMKRPSLKHFADIEAIKNEARNASQAPQAQPTNESASRQDTASPGMLRSISGHFALQLPGFSEHEGEQSVVIGPGNKSPMLTPQSSFIAGLDLNSNNKVDPLEPANAIAASDLATIKLTIPQLQTKNQKKLTLPNLDSLPHKDPAPKPAANISLQFPDPEDSPSRAKRSDFKISINPMEPNSASKVAPHQDTLKIPPIQEAEIEESPADKNIQRAISSDNHSYMNVMADEDGNDLDSPRSMRPIRQFVTHSSSEYLNFENAANGGKKELQENSPARSHQDKNSPGLQEIISPDTKRELFRNHLARTSEVQEVIKNNLWARSHHDDSSANSPTESQRGNGGNFISLLQQLTFELNKSSVLTARLKKSKDELRLRERECEKMMDEMVREKEENARRAKEINDLMLENQRLREQQEGVAEIAREVSQDDEPEDKLKKKEEKKARLLKKREHRLMINQKVMNQGQSDQRYGHQNNARELISLLNKGRFARFKNPMALKTVMRTIYTLITDRMEEIAQKPETRNVVFAEYVYSYYMQVFGIKEIGERKFTYFILSLKYYAQYFRVNMFSRLMGMIEGHKYDDDAILKYFEGVKYIESSQRGFPYKNKDTVVKVLVPYIRGDELVRHVFEEKIPGKELLELRRNVEKLREPDPTGLNAYLIDIDLLMEKIIERYSVIVSLNKQYVLDAFKACDLDGNNTISVNEFLLLNRYIEPKSFDLNICVTWFLDYADLLIGNQRNMSLDKFAVVSTNFNLFSERAQHEFIGITSSEEAEKVFRQLRIGWKNKYESLSSSLAGFESLTPEEIAGWEQILKVLDERMNLESTKELKPTLIAYWMTVREFDRIREEDEADTQSEDDDLVKAMTKLSAAKRGEHEHHPPTANVSPTKVSATSHQISRFKLT